jgi:hypothetical protein
MTKVRSGRTGKRLPGRLAALQPLDATSLRAHYTRRSNGVIVTRPGIAICAEAGRMILPRLFSNPGH